MLKILKEKIIIKKGPNECISQQIIYKLQIWDAKTNAL